MVESPLQSTQVTSSHQDSRSGGSPTTSGLRGRKNNSDGGQDRQLESALLNDPSPWESDRTSPTSQRGKVGQWAATALCGNDVLSSCLYTLGLVIKTSGKVAPICFILVSLILRLVRSVYATAVLTFPNNGGSYNLLAHVSPRPVAALAACLSVIAYIATCVVSAVTACEYLARVNDAIDPTTTSILLLCTFSALVLLGLRESTGVALAIFVVHMATLSIVAIGCLFQASSAGFQTLRRNLDMPYPRVPISETTVSSNLALAIFLGFSDAMLGVSGYETSAQFVEEMAPGVFQKTLRNLWIGVTLANPLLCFLAISVLPIETIAEDSTTVLAKMATVYGDWVFGPGSRWSMLLTTWLSIEAFIVLSGAVLTALVGIDGLLFQMATDRCLPSIFLSKNRWRGTHHVNILSFLVLCITQILLLQARIDRLAGIYSLAFLGVLACFTMGGMMLKLHASFCSSGLAQALPWWHVSGALGLILTALVGQFLGPFRTIAIFFGYFGPLYLVCLLCLYLPKWSGRWKSVQDKWRGLWGTGREGERSVQSEGTESGEESEGGESR